MAADRWFAIDTNTGQVRDSLAARPRQIHAQIIATFRRIGAALQLAVIREKLSGQLSALSYFGGPNTLADRTGTLRRAIYYKILSGPDDVTLTLGADAKKAKYARIQEYGGTIAAHGGKHLTIPLSPALTAKGVARVSPREFISNPESLGFEREFVNKSKTAIMGAVGTQATPVFALKSSVVIREHGYLRSTVAEKRALIVAQLEAMGRAASE